MESWRQQGTQPLLYEESGGRTECPASTALTDSSLGVEGRRAAAVRIPRALTGSWGERGPLLLVSPTQSGASVKLNSRGGWGGKSLWLQCHKPLLVLLRVSRSSWKSVSTLGQYTDFKLSLWFLFNRFCQFCLFFLRSESPRVVIWKWNSPMCYFLSTLIHFKEISLTSPECCVGALHRQKKS